MIFGDSNFDENSVNQMILVKNHWNVKGFVKTALPTHCGDHKTAH